MTSTTVCGWGAAAPSCSSKSDVKLQAGISRPAINLVPVVGLVNRRTDRQVRNLRWNQRTRSSTAGDSCNMQRWRAPSAKLKADSVNQNQFKEEVLESPVPVLVDFWATWCGPCRLMGIALDWAAQKYEGKVKCVKIETDLNEKLVDEYKVYGLPTLILFVNGQVVPNTKREGALTKEKLQEYIEANLPSIAATTTST